MGDAPKVNEVKILSYNTSYVNDAHHRILHPFLSESASIMQKAIRMYSDNNIQDIIQQREGNWAANLYTTLSRKDNANGSSEQVNKPDNTPDNKPDNTPDNKLENIRLQMADAATDHIRDKMTTDAPDFCALIEQTIHVPDNNPAASDFGEKHGMHKYNLGDKNKDYGILRRIDKLGIVNDLNAQTNTSTNDKNYNIVYDNIINTDLPGAAEGIAICMNAAKYPTGKLYKWDRTKLPIFSQLATKYNKDKKDDNTNKANDVYFYSDDLGKVVTDTTFNSGNDVYCVRKGEAVADMGRPIMLSICENDTGIHIFVAVHSVNLFQLKAINKGNVDYFNKYRETYNAIKSWIAELNNPKEDADVNNVNNVNNDIKTFLQNTEIYTKCTGIAATKIIKDLVVDTSSAENIQLVNDICKTICNSIGDFITKSFENATKHQSDTQPTNVHVYLAGDFNDPQGHILNILNESGITFKISGKEYCVKFPIESTDTKVKILDHSPCCANADSCKDPTPASTLGPIGAPTIERIYGKSTDDTKKYPVYNNNTQFIDSVNFNYKGDYALYGKAVVWQGDPAPTCVVQTTITGFTPDDVLFNEQHIMASDHQSVFATYTSTTPVKGGGNRHKNKQYHSSTKKRRSINRHSSNKKDLRRTPRRRSVVPK